MRKLVIEVEHEGDADVLIYRMLCHFQVRSITELEYDHGGSYDHSTCHTLEGQRHVRKPYSYEDPTR